DFADALEVARGWREAAAGVLYRLKEDGGNRFGALEFDGFADALRRPQAEVLLVVRELLRGPVEVGVRHAEGARHQRLERGLHAWQRGDGQGALRGAVVGQRAGDDFVLARLALE